MIHLLTCTVYKLEVFCVVVCYCTCRAYTGSEFVVLFVFVALRPMSTAMVIAGRSVHLTTLFPGQA